ncbi:hypothetical protein TNCV_4440861 [Trichonephila clavipes]|nr:hypothetical protein TNCV_4440861 [Trichonephila clavipes]
MYRRAIRVKEESNDQRKLRAKMARSPLMMTTARDAPQHHDGGLIANVRPGLEHEQWLGIRIIAEKCGIPKTTIHRFLSGPSNELTRKGCQTMTKLQHALHSFSRSFWRIGRGNAVPTTVQPHSGSSAFFLFQNSE